LGVGGHLTHSEGPGTGLIHRHLRPGGGSSPGAPEGRRRSRTRGDTPGAPGPSVDRWSSRTGTGRGGAPEPSHHHGDEKVPDRVTSPTLRGGGSSLTMRRATPVMASPPSHCRRIVVATFYGHRPTGERSRMVPSVSANMQTNPNGEKDHPTSIEVAARTDAERPGGSAEHRVTARSFPTRPNPAALSVNRATAAMEAGARRGLAPAGRCGRRCLISNLPNHRGMLPRSTAAWVRTVDLVPPFREAPAIWSESDQELICRPAFEPETRTVRIYPIPRL